MIPRNFDHLFTDLWTQGTWMEIMTNLKFCLILIKHNRIWTAQKSRMLKMKNLSFYHNIFKFWISYKVFYDSKEMIIMHSNRFNSCFLIHNQIWFYDIDLFVKSKFWFLILVCYLENPVSQITVQEAVLHLVVVQEGGTSWHGRRSWVGVWTGVPRSMITSYTTVIDGKTFRL